MTALDRKPRKPPTRRRPTNAEAEQLRKVAKDAIARVRWWQFASAFLFVSGLCLGMAI